MAYNPEEDIKVSDLPEKTTDVVSDDKLLVIDSEDANILKQIDASKVGGGSGTGDMLKSVYDKNNDGVVDDAEALGGKPASDYALSDNTQDKLESGVNIKTINGNSILGPGNIEIQGGSGTVDTEMSDTSTNAVQNKVIKAYVDSQSGGDGTTKTFVTDSTPDLVKGKEILDWYRAGKNPIIMMSDKTYYLTYCDPAGTTDGKMVFSTTVGYENETWGDNTYYEITIRFNGTDEVNEVGGGVGTNGYLDTRIEYTTPYTPLYDGSPATKKYVDDAVAGGSGGGKMPVDINSTGISDLQYIYPKTIDGVSTLPRAFRVDYVVHEYYPLTNPTWTKDHQGTGYINFTLDDMNVSTNPSDWEFGCFFDGVYHNDCLIFIGYDQNGAYSGSQKRVPSSINSSGRCVNNIVEDGRISSSYGANVRVIRTAIF